jgi:hypothetical protein
MTKFTHLAHTKRIRVKTLLLAIAAFLVFIYFDFFAHRKPLDCSMERHFFDGKSYDVELCRLSRSNEAIDRMSLRIYDVGLLVAERKFDFYTPPDEDLFNKIGVSVF